MKLQKLLTLTVATAACITQLSAADADMGAPSVAGTSVAGGGASQFSAATLSGATGFNPAYVPPSSTTLKNTAELRAAFRTSASEYRKMRRALATTNHNVKEYVAQLTQALDELASIKAVASATPSTTERMRQKITTLIAEHTETLARLATELEARAASEATLATLRESEAALKTKEAETTKKLAAAKADAAFWRMATISGVAFGGAAVLAALFQSGAFSPTK